MRHPGVAAARPADITPPTVRAGFVRIEIAEGVDKARRQQLGKFAAFLVGKTGVHAVGFGVFQVNLLVGHVKVATDHHGFFLIQPF